MTIEKLASGSYRAKIMVRGKTYRITYPYKPSKREAEEDLRELASKEEVLPNNKTSFEEAAAKYIRSKENVLSPSTIRNYMMINKNIFPWFASLDIDLISQMDINKFVNLLCLDKSPKTVRNYHSFVSSVINTYRPEFKICTVLPQKKKNEPYIPSDEEVKAIVAELEGTEYYIPTILACYGMRRSEICALTPEDIEGDVVHITKSMVINSKNEFVLKQTKTTESERDIMIPMMVADLIREQGYVYKGHPSNITKNLHRIEEKLGIESFPMHKLRHYFASKMLTLTDSKTVQALGGWKTDNVMKTVYAHSMKAEQEKAKRAAVSKLNSSIF